MSAMIRSRAVTLLVLGSLSSFGPLSMDLYLPALPRVSDDLHAADHITQLSLSACLIGLALGQLVAGPLSDRWGRRTPLLVGVTGWAVTSFCCAVAPGIWTLIGLRLLQGMAGAAGLAVARAIVRDLFDGPEVARVFALLSMVSGTAPVIAPLLGSQLLRVTSWRGLFVVLGLAGAVLVWAAWSGLGETLPPERRHTGGLGRLAGVVREISRDRVFLGAAVVLASSGAVLFSYIGLSSFVLQQQYGLSTIEFGLDFAANSTGIISVGFLSALLLRRYAISTVLAGGLTLQVLGATGLVTAVLAHAPLGLVLVPLFLTVASVGAVTPTATGLALQLHAASAGTASALLGAAQFIVGGLIGPVISVGGASARAMTVSMVVAAVIAGTAYLGVVRRAVCNTSPAVTI